MLCSRLIAFGAAHHSQNSLAAHHHLEYLVINLVGGFFLPVGAILLTAELLCLQSIEVLLRHSFPLQAKKLSCKQEASNCKQTIVSYLVLAEFCSHKDHVFVNRPSGCCQRGVGVRKPTATPGCMSRRDAWSF